MQGQGRRKACFWCKRTSLFNWLCWQPVRTGRKEKEDEENRVGGSLVAATSSFLAGGTVPV